MAARAPKELTPPAQVRQLEAALAAGPLAKGYLVRGEEVYFRQRAVDAIVARARAIGAEVLVHDGADPDFDAQGLMGDLGTAPMFAAEQLIVARGVEGSLTKRGKEDAPLARAILGFLSRGAPQRSLLISVDSLRADHAVAKAVTASGGPVLTLRRLYDSPPPWNPDPRQTELVQWCLERARELGLRIDAGQALYVAAATGNDLGALDTQLERLRQSGGGDPRKAVAWQASGSPFAAADALCRGDLPRALASLESLFQGGMVGRDGSRVVDEGALTAILIGSLLRGVRQGLAASEAKARGRSPDEVLEGGGPMRERAKAELEQRLARRPTPQIWRDFLAAVLDLDRRGKSGSRLDVSDFAHLAVAWRVDAPPQSAARAPARAGGRGPR